jgi:hypothetical protein
MIGPRTGGIQKNVEQVSGLSADDSRRFLQRLEHAVFHIRREGRTLSEREVNVWSGWIGSGLLDNLDGYNADMKRRVAEILRNASDSTAHTSDRSSEGDSSYVRSSDFLSSSP